MQKRSEKNLLLTVATLFIVLFLLTLAIFITIWSVPIYSQVVDKLNLSDAVNLPKDTILENYKVLLKYLSDPNIKELNMPDFPSSASGAFHFYEVKKLFILDYALMLISGIVSLVYILNLKKYKLLYKFKNIFRVLVFLPLVILLLVAFFFDKVFYYFHKLFFNNDAWLFNPQTDPIILVLPQEFFMVCFLEAFILLELGLILFYFLGRKYYKKRA